jgi:hypothetical protein
MSGDARKPFLIYWTVFLVALWFVTLALTCYVMFNYKYITTESKIFLFGEIVALSMGTFNTVVRWQYLAESKMMYKHINKQVSDAKQGIDEIKIILRGNDVK